MSRYDSTRKLARSFALYVALLSTSPAFAQFTHQGTKLTGSGTGTSAQLGTSVALSADGNTMLAGAPGDHSGAGAGVVFIRGADAWTQQGSKLVGSGGAASAQASSVALSADGNTAALGGPSDNGSVGAVWVFTRSGGTWAQQGSKLVGSGAISASLQGSAVALSADGNTLIVGGENDDGAKGAAWIFTRSGSMWTQQGGKLVGSGAIGPALQGISVALSADGNTAMIGGPNDNGGAGAAWIFTRSGGNWAQQDKLLGTGGSNVARKGRSVALSADGNTALSGGFEDTGDAGATWVFTRTGTTWTQQGSKLVGSGAGPGAAQQGYALALASDGNTALIGGPGDNFAVGAIWLFKRSSGVWTQSGAKLVGNGGVPSFNGVTDVIAQGTSVAIAGDGNTLASGGPGDGGGLQGAVWMFAQPAIAVTPAANITAAGNVGGPFSPPSFDYTLKAPIATAYSITGLPDWLTTTSTSGTVQGGDPVTVTFSVNGTANAKAVGSYGPATINFTNSTNGIGNAAISATLTVGSAGPVSVVSAVLPASRSVQIGVTATAFATIINTSSNVGTNCGLGFGSDVPAGFKYQTTDPATNVTIGTVNTPANIPAGGNQSYVFAITPSGLFAPTDLPITAGCTNGSAATSIVGLNTLLLSSSASPVPDVVALAASVDPGYVDIPGTNGTGAFSVATVNVGITGAITASADTGSATLPVAITLCQTDANAQCTNPASPASSVNLTINANATPTFSIFVKGSGNVTNDPAHNRVFVRFKDAGGATRGATSVAVRTQ